MSHRHPFALLFSLLLFASVKLAAEVPSSDRSQVVLLQQSPILRQQLEHKNLQLGNAIFIRIFKQSLRLELWVENNAGTFILFKRYKICRHSGDLGPKIKEGDGQSPEGFYFVKAKGLNPWSQFFLSFNLGFPNAYDRHHGRTGSYLMVHGSCVSIGCYAMTDAGISEIYTLAHHAFNKGQRFFRVHIFPFELSDAVLAKHRDSQWYPFWLELKPGYDYFVGHKRPPNITHLNGRYIVESNN